MDPRFAQAVVAAISASFNYTRQVDERTGGSGQNEGLFNEAIMTLQNLTNQVNNELIDTPEEPPVT
jgi:hypothetical protein